MHLQKGLSDCAIRINCLFLHNAWLKFPKNICFKKIACYLLYAEVIATHCVCALYKISLKNECRPIILKNFFKKNSSAVKSKVMASIFEHFYIAKMIFEGALS